MRAICGLILTGLAWAQSSDDRPNVTNAKFEVRAVSGELGSQIKGVAATWFGYEIKSRRHDEGNCCWNGGSRQSCGLEPGTKNSGTYLQSGSPIRLEGTDRSAVLVRVENNSVSKIRVYSVECGLDAGGLPFVWLTGVGAHASIAYLQGLVEQVASRDEADKAVFALSQHDDPEATRDLIQDAKTNPMPHVRSQALFWLAQAAGREAAATITDAIQNDPNTEVKKRAVFALSQLPAGESTQKLIEVAQTQRNPEVRKQAFFWLGQSHDPRALAFIEQVLTK